MTLRHGQHAGHADFIFHAQNLLHVLMPSRPSFVGPLLADQAQVELGDAGLVSDILAVLIQVIRGAGFSGPHMLWRHRGANVMPNHCWRQLFCRIHWR